MLGGPGRPSQLQPSTDDGTGRRLVERGRIGSHDLEALALVRASGGRVGLEVFDVDVINAIWERCNRLMKQLHPEGAASEPWRLVQLSDHVRPF